MQNWDSYDVIAFHLVSIDHCNHNTNANSLNHNEVIQRTNAYLSQIIERAQ